MQRCCMTQVVIRILFTCNGLPSDSLNAIAVHGVSLRVLPAVTWVNVFAHSSLPRHPGFDSILPSPETCYVLQSVLTSLLTSRLSASTLSVAAG